MASFNAPDKKPRTVHSFPFPVVGEPWGAPEEELGPDGVPTGAMVPPLHIGPDIWDGQEPSFRSAGLVSLRGSEEELCMRESKGDAARFQRLCLCRSLRFADERPLDVPAAEALVADLPPLARELLHAAHNDLHAVSGELSATFRRGHRISSRAF